MELGCSSSSRSRPLGSARAPAPPPVRRWRYAPAALGGSATHGRLRSDGWASETSLRSALKPMHRAPSSSQRRPAVAVRDKAQRSSALVLLSALSSMDVLDMLCRFDVAPTVAPVDRELGLPTLADAYRLELEPQRVVTSGSCIAPYQLVASTDLPFWRTNHESGRAMPLRWPTAGSASCLLTIFCRRS